MSEVCITRMKFVRLDDEGTSVGVKIEDDFGYIFLELEHLNLNDHELYEVILRESNETAHDILLDAYSRSSGIKIGTQLFAWPTLKTITEKLLGIESVSDSLNNN